MTQLELEITNTAGLHARPAARLVKEAAVFASKVTISTAAQTVNAKSILAVMGLGLKKEAKFLLCADGHDEAECLASLKNLVEGKFGED